MRIIQRWVLRLLGLAELEARVQRLEHQLKRERRERHGDVLPMGPRQ